ncbi:hypothetical protein H310_09608 [Aphanomyces invadans]|uniref:Uncharacterized protein n=1 Tax=Aphanomyces invadans TaxID=157072 RepID=A0A024TV47_9STRA|nr:hypothetical protein H310_09608 [Aphanomyces invadans]ETV97227.1 hypothetical protein H310_09608 [Aphanomyces invadans]|eukprot:XP_008873935.1 hypothetical protein H310_09608 [Aphanomyces invadans]
MQNLLAMQCVDVGYGIDASCRRHATCWRRRWSLSLALQTLTSWPRRQDGIQRMRLRTVMVLSPTVSCLSCKRWSCYNSAKCEYDERSKVCGSGQWQCQTAIGAVPGDGCAVQKLPHREAATTSPHCSRLSWCLGHIGYFAPIPSHGFQPLDTFLGGSH